MNKTIYALGFFDGVHMGHGALLCAVRTLAKEHSAQSGVVTFGSHPDTLVTGHTPRLINTAQDRQKLLQEKYHMERVLTLPFDEAMRTMPWQDFLALLRRDYGASGFVCGEDFRFGGGGGLPRPWPNTAGRSTCPGRWCRTRLWTVSGFPAPTSGSRLKPVIWPRL